MIEFVTGDFFDYEADIRINTVNCVGVMGAGVALEFKNRYPDMFKAYVEVCKKDEIAPGKPFIWEETDLFSRCIIINLPTKMHWKNPSEYEYIEKDLVWLKEYLLTVSEDSVVTLPALGCGHGNLDWNIVKDMICHYLNEIKAKILVFEPGSSNKDFDTIYFRSVLQKNDVKTLFPSDKCYPENLADTFGKEIYCRGCVELLELKKISLICGNSFSEREYSAIFKVLEELDKDKYSFVIGLNNKKSEELATSLLEKGYSLITIIPYGILNFKKQVIFAKFMDKMLVLSYVKPKQEFKKYEYVNSFKIRLRIADVILHCGDEYDDIKKIIKYLKCYRNVFYINYWNETINEFVNINAQKIGINPETRRPNVLPMKYYLEEE